MDSNSDVNISNPNKVKRSKWGKTLSYLFILTLLIFVIALVANYFRGTKSSGGDYNASDYYAFFLSNDQVYFGHIENKDQNEIVISNVYYVSLESQNSPNDFGSRQFQLIKLGNELHGPTDKMYINRAQVLFYEQLRKDSQVVVNIESQDVYKN